MSEMLAFWSLALERLFLSISLPIGSLLVFLYLSQNLPPKVQRQLARKICLCSGFILCAFALGAAPLLSLLDLPLHALRIAGGILLLYLAQQTLKKPTDDPLSPPQASKRSTFLFPLSFPLIAGPGALTQTLLLYEESAWRPLYLLGILLSITLILSIYYLCFCFARCLVEYLGSAGLQTLRAFLSILLACFAASMIIEGALYAFSLSP